MKRRVAILLFLLLTAGCTSADGATPTAAAERMTNSVYRWVDPDYRVVCWTFYTGGISCLPEPEKRP